VIYSGTINTFAFDYADNHRVELKNISPDAEGKNYVDNYQIDDSILDSFLLFANKDGFKASPKELEKSGEMIRNRLKALIGRNIWGNELYYKVLNQMDKDIEVSLMVAEEMEMKHVTVLNDL
jgi:carboxyl-terminal processing protease